MIRALWNLARYGVLTGCPHVRWRPIGDGVAECVRCQVIELNGVYDPARLETNQYGALFAEQGRAEVPVRQQVID